MGRNEINDEHIQKLQKTGEDGIGYMITLPQDLVEKLSMSGLNKQNV